MVRVPVHFGEHFQSERAERGDGERGLYGEHTATGGGGGDAVGQLEMHGGGAVVDEVLGVQSVPGTAVFDPAILAILKAGLIPTAVDSTYVRRDVSPFRQHTDEQLYKTDYQMTQKQRLTLSYFHQTGDYVVNPSGNTIVGWVVHDYKFAQHESNIAHTWTLTNNTVNQLLLNFTRLIGGRNPTPADSLATYGSKFAEQLPNGDICGTPAEVGRRVDLSDFAITDRVKFQLRGESTNVFNLTNLAQPQGSLASASFGKVTTAIAGGEFWEPDYSGWGKNLVLGIRD